MINIIVVTHGEFGAYLVEAAEEIVGRQENGVACVGISPRLSVPEVRARILRKISELGAQGDFIIVVDMPGGTPCNVTIPLVREISNTRVVSGANLYMLIVAFNNRHTASLDALTEMMLAAAKRSVVDIKSAFLAKN